MNNLEMQDSLKEVERRFKAEGREDLVICAQMMLIFKQHDMEADRNGKKRMAEWTTDEIISHVLRCGGVE